MLYHVTGSRLCCSAWCVDGSMSWRYIFSRSLTCSTQNFEYNVKLKVVIHERQLMKHLGSCSVYFQLLSGQQLYILGMKEIKGGLRTVTPYPVFPSGQYWSTRFHQVVWHLLSQRWSHLKGKRGCMCFLHVKITTCFSHTSSNTSDKTKRIVCGVDLCLVL